MYKFIIFLLFAGLCFARSGFSQSMLRIQHISVNEGLSQSSVYSVVQDSYGFMWMATGDGLNRYDGREFIVYKSSLNTTQKGSLKDRNINSLIFEDRYKNLWFSADQGVYCMNRKTRNFALRLNKYDAKYASIIAGSDNENMWVLVHGSGMHAISIKDSTRKLYPFSKENTQNATAVTIIKNAVFGKNGIWFATTEGAFFFNNETKKDELVMKQGGINKLHLLSNGNLVMSLTDTLLVYNTATSQYQYLPISVTDKEGVIWNSIVEDTLGGFMYCSEIDGGRILKLDMHTMLYEVLFFQDNIINNLYIDRSRNMWVGTEGAGVFKLDLKSSKFKCYAPITGKEAGFMVKSLFYDSAGDIWMGVFDKGVIRYNPKNRTEKIVPLPVRKDGVQFSNIFQDSSGNIVLAANNYLYWLDAQSNQVISSLEISSYKYSTDKKPKINVVTEWRKNQYLVGTNMGIYMVDRSTDKAKFYIKLPMYADSLVNGWIYNFHKSVDGSIYVGKRNGFAKITFGNDTTHRLIEYGLRNLPIRHFYKSTHTPLLWLATEQGLVAYEEGKGRYKVFDEESGIANSYVYAILPQNDSVLWLSTNKGIAKAEITYRGLLNTTIRFTNYTSEDGLQSNEFNTGAYYKHQNGTMIFGGISGINWFKPDSVTINKYKASPSVTGIYINDTLMTCDSAMYVSKLELPHNRNTVSFTLRALEYTTPLKNRFAYMLQGLDKDWVYTTNDKVRYSNLEPGEYVFLLKVSNNEDIWNEQPLRIVVLIAPPFWSTWWFRSILFAMGLTIVLLIVRYYTYLKVRAKTIELERQHALNTERMRISKDVHDDIGSGLSKIALLSALANRKLKENELPSKDIDNISAISKQLVDNMHDLVWVLNPENTTLDNLVSRIREYCADYLDVSDVSSSLFFPDVVPQVSIYGEVQRNVFSTVKEALNNCMKHSKATHVTVTLTISNEQLAIYISDNGIGFSNIATNGNGLRNMQNRIEQINGKFLVTSEVYVGTTVSVAIPFLHLSAERIEIHK